MFPNTPPPVVIVSKALHKFYKDDGAFLASGLTFGLLFYCVPFALLSVSALSYTIVKSIPRWSGSAVFL